MKELTTTQKKEWAKTLYLKENLTQQEIADRVGVTRVTVNSWINKEKWEEQKTGITLTREEQVANLYRQVAEINRAIADRPVGERYANSKEADILGKLSSSIEKMEKDVGIADIISVPQDICGVSHARHATWNNQQAWNGQYPPCISPSCRERSYQSVSYSLLIVYP